MKTLRTDNQNPPKFSTLKFLWPYLWSENRPDLRRRVIYAGFFLVLSKMCNLFAPFFFKYSVDHLYPQVGVGHLAWGVAVMVIGYGLCRVLAQGFNELKDFLFTHVTQNAVRTLGLKTFRKLHRLGLPFHLEKKMGYVSRIIERGINSIDVFLRFTTFNILPTFFEIILVAVTLWFFYGAAFSLIISVTLLTYIGFTLAFTEWRTHYVRRMNQLDSEANGTAIDSLLNYETIKYFGAEDHESKRYDVSLASYEKAAVRSYQTLSLLNITQGCIISVGLILVMILAAQDVSRGLLTPGDFVLLNTYLIQLYLPLNFLGFAYREIKMALLNMDTMFKTLQEPESIQDIEGAPDLVMGKGKIEFKNVCFAYNPERSILHNLSFVIQPGQTVAIVGASGAGKSTLSRLLYRFYDVQQGSILIDDQDVRCVTQASLRAAIGMVPQDTVLFNESIFYNIAYGHEGASVEEVHNAAKMANICGFIQKLPQGYDTLVGERGLKLSGGEKQRVAIARTLLKNPAILIFDEATSALDTHTEREIQQAILEVAKTRTTLIIAHRLSTVVDADQIFVMDKGQIIEAGTHHDLLTKAGPYYRLWTHQTKNRLWDDGQEHPNSQG